MRIALLATILFVSSSVFAGPPILCKALEIESGEESLIWHADGDAFGFKEDYDVKKNLVADVLKLLKDETRLLVRMETIRRAGHYVMRDKETGLKLREAVQARLDAKNLTERQRALAQFDAGYLDKCLTAANVIKNGVKGSNELLNQAAKVLGKDDKDVQLAIKNQ